MQKAKVYTIQGSNLELFGTDVEHHCKEAAAGEEKQWHHTGEAPGLKIWRIEKFKVVPWPVEHYGEFYDGDSYIVFNTHGSGPNFDYDIHFWLGENTTQDEAGAAAYKTVELDDYHKGTPVEHREVQGHESALFSSYFPKGISILKGGVDSGFRHVTPEQYKPRLFHLHGNYREVRVYEVPLARDSLNSGDVFVLDDGLKIFQWNGSKSGGMERLKAGQYAHALRDERAGKPEVHVFDEDGGSEHFWNLLGGKGHIKTAEEAGTPTAPPPKHTKALFKFEDESGKLVFSKVAEGTVRKNQLQSSSAFVFDAGDHIYVWIGKNANSVERRSALGYAHKYLEDHGLPTHTPITKIPEAAHNAHFDAAFDH